MRRRGNGAATQHEEGALAVALKTKPQIYSRLKNAARNRRSELWFRPTIGALGAILLALAVVVLDQWLDLPFFSPISRATATDSLRFAAGGMLTIVTVTQSVLMLVLSIAAGQASPRTVPELMADRVTQNALTSFLATFVFAIATLVLIEFTAIERTGITIAFGLSLLLLAAAIKYLVQWIHHVADTLKLNRIVERIYRQSEDALQHYLATASDSGTADQVSPDRTGESRKISASRAGYVQLIDLEEIERCARSCGTTVRLMVREGDFVHQALPVMTLQGGADIDDATEAQFQGLVVIAAERSPTGDPLLGIELLAEIACRALSPSLNDPQSALTCIHYQGALLAQAGSVERARYPGAHSASDVVASVPVTFEDILKRAIRPVVREGAGSAEVGLLLLETLGQLARVSALDYLEAIKEEARHLLDYANQRLVLERDRKLLSAKMQDLIAEIERRSG